MFFDVADGLDAQGQQGTLLVQLQNELLRLLRVANVLDEFRAQENTLASQKRSHKINKLSSKIQILDSIMIPEGRLVAAL